MEIKTDKDILNLISCPKVFSARPSKPHPVNKNITQKFTVKGVDNDLDFSIFITYSALMEEDFSIGLMCDSLLLLRLNGFHGTTKAGFYSSAHHAYPHAHILSVEDIDNYRSDKPSNIEDMTGNYININTAKLYFFKRCGIMGFDKYFEFEEQLPLVEND